MTQHQQSPMNPGRFREVVGGINAWVDEHRGSAVPKSPFGAALEFAYNQRSALEQFLDDANIPLDNNMAERMLRRIALARRSSMFVGHDTSGQRYAVNMSLVASCRRNGIDPTAYLTDVLPRIADYPATRIAELLPDRWTPAG